MSQFNLNSGHLLGLIDGLKSKTCCFYNSVTQSEQPDWNSCNFYVKERENKEVDDSSEESFQYNNNNKN